MISPAFLISLLLFMSFVMCNRAAETVSDDISCSICARVIRSVITYAASNNIASSVALDKYCRLSSLEVEEQRFCYNIETVKSDLNRMLAMNADESRVCKKVKSINADWCTAKQAVNKSPLSSSGSNKDKKDDASTGRGRGIIYE